MVSTRGRECAENASVVLWHLWFDYYCVKAVAAAAFEIEYVRNYVMKHLMVVAVLSLIPVRVVESWSTSPVDALQELCLCFTRTKVDTHFGWSVFI